MPVDVTYNADSGATVRGGIAAPPAWLDGQPLNEWFAISGTTGAGGAAVDFFSGFAVREDTSELACLACGGHGDSSDNRVTMLNLEDAAPTWAVRTAGSGIDGSASTDDGLGFSSVTRPIDSTHYPDGRPTSRHSYRHTHWVPGVARFMLMGAREVWSNDPPSYANVDGFDPATNLWDAAGTWPAVPVLGTYGTVKDADGNVYSGAWDRFNSASGTWTDIAPGGSGPIARSPIFYDSTRNTAVSIMWADGFGAGTAQVNVLRYDIAGNTLSGITLSGTGLAQFETDQPSYAGGDYCPDNDKFLFYDGKGAAAGRMYWITPNDTTTWGIEVASFGAGSAELPATATGGVNGKMWYVPRLKGFVLMPSSADGLYFLRTA